MRLKMEPVDISGPLLPGWPLKPVTREELAELYSDQPQPLRPAESDEPQHEHDEYDERD